jgi:ADP-heptose:LPS heptosyltransferase
LHPGSGSAGKCWPSFQDLADRIVGEARVGSRGLRGLESVFLLGPNETAFTASVPRLENLTLREVAQQLRSCRGYIGNDAGITHLAAYLGTPVVALFGPTDPRIWGPRGRRVRIVWKQPLDAITVEEILEHLEWMTKNRPT